MNVTGTVTVLPEAISNVVAATENAEFSMPENVAVRAFAPELLMLKASSLVSPVKIEPNESTSSETEAL